MNAFTIKDLENLSGIKAHTIRIWEQRYAFLKPQRTGTNIRFYNNEELKTILNVALLNKNGFKISHIDKMKNGELNQKVMSLAQTDAQNERVVNEMINLMAELSMDEFESVLDEYIVSKGIERAITQVIFPFLEKIGILWVTNHINPAQEHLVSNIIRQKLIVGIEKLAPVTDNSKTVLLFLPEGEHHELALLFMYYFIKSKSLKVWYLGANLPIKDLDFIIKEKKPYSIYSHLTSVASNFNFEKFLTKLQNVTAGVDVVISGRITQNYKKKVPPNVHFKTSLSEVIDGIAKL